VQIRELTPGRTRFAGGRGVFDAEDVVDYGSDCGEAGADDAEIDFNDRPEGAVDVVPCRKRGELVDLKMRKK